MMLQSLDSDFVFYTIATLPASSSPTLYRFFALDSSYSTSVQAVLFPSRTAVATGGGGLSHSKTQASESLNLCPTGLCT